MSNLWNRVSYIGVPDTSILPHAKYVILSNKIATLLLGLCIILSVMLEGFFGGAIASKIIIGLAFLIIPVWIFNYLDLTNFSRIYLVMIAPTAVIAIALYVKNYNRASIEEFEYYDSRLILLAVSMLPLIIFDLKERAKLFPTLLYSFFLLLLYDPIHELFSLGYFQTGHDSRNYLFINYAIVAAYGFIIASIWVLKSFITSGEKRNLKLVRDLEQGTITLKFKNEKLKNLNAEIEEQNRSILLQAEELEASQEKLHEANSIIEDQKEKLLATNRILEIKLNEQDKDMVQINTELVRRNNELRQFGYTVSHNLRGPIASLLGLINLFEEDNSNEHNKNIIHHIGQVTENLEVIIKDLNRLVELRNDLLAERLNLNISEELKIVEKLVQEDLRRADGIIRNNFKVNEVYGVKAYLQSILYNLISNSIKFRNPSLPLIIEVSTQQKNGFVEFIIKDNGAGFDLQRHIDHVFSLYKRFHTHTPGRGLGLYLTKLQVEAMGGSIKVHSIENKGTTFTFSLPHSINGLNH